MKWLPYWVWCAPKITPICIVHKVNETFPLSGLQFPAAKAQKVRENKELPMVQTHITHHQGGS